MPKSNVCREGPMAAIFVHRTLKVLEKTWATGVRLVLVHPGMTRRSSLEVEPREHLPF
jgi:hypothetical protein